MTENTRAEVAAQIDVHCHIQSDEFDGDRQTVLQRAAAVGIRRVFAMGEDFEDNLRVLNLAHDFPQSIAPCLGLHPEHIDASTDIQPVVQQIREHRDRLMAIGEVGLDFWLARDDHERQGAQRAALREFATLSLELDLPLSIHSRSAGHHAVSLLEECGAKRVCMHAFDGAAKYAARAVNELGFFFSVPPSIVRSPQKQKLVRRLPLEALLLETDSPVLGPEAGQRNEPAYGMAAARAIAEIKGVELPVVLSALRGNTQRLFGV